jgi:hypothetical protein
MRLDIEIYTDEYGYAAWIGDDCGGSGIEVSGSTPEELGNNMSGYIADYAQRLTETDEEG